jgi:hypothetical protein
LIPIIDRTRHERIYNSTLEVLNDWDEGRILEKYAWKAIKKALPERLEAAANGNFIGKRLEKSNYYGLKVATDSNGNAKSLEGVTNPRKIARFEKKYGYKMDLKFDKDEKKEFGLKKLQLKGGGKEFDILKTDSGLKYFNLENRDEKLMFAQVLNGNKSTDLEYSISNLISKKRYGVSFKELSDSQKNEVGKILGNRDGGDGGLYADAKSFRDWSKQKLGSNAGPDSPNYNIVNIAIGSSILTSAGLTSLKMKRKDVKIFLDSSKIFDNKLLENFNFSNEQHQKLLAFMLSDDRNPSPNKLANILFGKKGERVLAGELSTEQMEQLKGFLNEMQMFRKWLDTLPEDVKKKLLDGKSKLELFKELKSAKSKGIFNYTDPTNLNSTKLKLLLSVKKKNDNLTAGYKITERKFIGRLEKVHKRLQELQKKISESFIGRIIRFLNNWKDIIAKKVSELTTKLISKAIATLLGAAAASTGLLAVIMPMIKAVAEKVISKMLSYGEAAIKGLFKLDFSQLNEMLAKDLPKFFACCSAVGCAILLPIWLFVLMIVAVVGTSVSPVDMAEITDQMLTEYICETGHKDCGDPDGMPAKTGTDNTIARISYHIVENLDRGFWCFHNKPLDTMHDCYRNRECGGLPIFNQTIFDLLGEIACEDAVREAGDEWYFLFWCTWLTRKAYIYAGAANAKDYLLPGACYTQMAFQKGGNGYSFIPNEEGVIEKIQVGDVIFYTHGSCASHVGIVYEVNYTKNKGGYVGYIITLESNANWKTANLTASTKGRIESSMSLKVSDFGHYSGTFNPPETPIPGL